ncbi:hypothetical protein BKA70DRAFT_1375721 [Coprinopsis sp. MPI-PUGE-AT-0042]|nr:hypothetical protein BKA70DRAFT_1375721 [Coprinopsis sp. MPI-PUGE-AT-0042]
MADVQVALPVPAPFSPAPATEVPEPATTGASDQTTPPSHTDEEPTATEPEEQTEAQPSGSVEEPATDAERPGSSPVDEAATTPLDPQVLPVGAVEDVNDTEDWKPDINDFPFWEEDELDAGPVLAIPYICWDPDNVPGERLFPFHDLALEESVDILRDVLPNANVSKLLSKHSQEYHSMSSELCYLPLRTDMPSAGNYVRGQTLKQLRMSSVFKNVVPGALRKFLDLPLDCYLLHLSRGLIMPRAKEIWAASYSNHADTVPTFNPTIPPLKWTAMLYTSAVCDFCGRKGALMDFALKERYCEPCQDVMLQDRSDLRPKLVDFSREADDIFDLLIPTYRQCGERYQTSYESSENARYRVKEFEAMLKELQEWYMTIDEGYFLMLERNLKSGSKSDGKRPTGGTLYAPLNSVVWHDLTFFQYATQANNWAMNIAYSQGSEVYERQQKTAKKIAARLIRMGHDTRDVECADSDIFYILRNHNFLDFNTRVFETVKDEVLVRVDGHKRDRFRKERREKTTKLLADYKKTLKPERWQRMPPMEVLLYQEPFYDYLNGPLEDTPELTLETAKENYLSRSRIGRQRRLELYQMIPGHEMPDAEPEPGTEEGLSDEDRATRARERENTRKEILGILMDQRMNLATSVFSCATCKQSRHSAMSLIGWDTTLTHMCGSMSSWYHTSFEFCSVGYAAAANIIRSVGLNPETATPAELDALDARFFCLNCPVTLHRKVRGRKAYTWRECVSSACCREREDHGHAIPSWTRLSAETTAFVREHEPPPPVFRKANWGCNHCPEHFEKPVMRKEAIAHVKTAHSIESPVDGVDFLDFKHRYEKGGNYRGRHIFHFGVEPTCNLVCKNCRSGKLKKMWTTLNLIPHLFHK